MIDNNIDKQHIDMDGDEDMVLQTKIEKIISVSNWEFDEFSNYQQQRINELKKLKEQQKQGVSIDVSPIVKSLQRSGFLDKHGEIAEPYNRLFVHKK